MDVRTQNIDQKLKFKYIVKLLFPVFVSVVITACGGGSDSTSGATSNNVTVVGQLPVVGVWSGDIKGKSIRLSVNEQANATAYNPDLTVSYSANLSVSGCFTKALKGASTNDGLQGIFNFVNDPNIPSLSSTGRTFFLLTVDKFALSRAIFVGLVGPDDNAGLSNDCQFLGSGVLRK